MDRFTLLPSITLLGVLLIVAAPVRGQDTAAEPASHVMTAAADLAFEPLEVPGFDSGMKIAMIHGNPMAEAGDYTIRLSFPDGYRFPAHWHPNAEHLTVLEGILLLSIGDAFDESTLVEYQAGDFMYIPPTMSHYGGAQGETVIQLHGDAPFTINLTETAS